jgi:nitronate monooxygenase
MRINVMTQLKTEFTEPVGIDFPIICGPMYPCSNPELVAAVSEAEAEGMGIIQPKRGKLARVSYD